MYGFSSDCTFDERQYIVFLSTTPQTKEKKMTTLPISSRQAGYLNSIAQAAKYYKQSCEQIASNAQRDLEKLNNNQHISGPSHQTMFEHVKYFGELQVLLQNVFMVFDPSIFDQNEHAQEDRKAYINMVNSWVEMATTGPRGNDYDVYFISEFSK
jgi:hypothetical protein